MNKRFPNFFEPSKWFVRLSIIFLIWIAIGSDSESKAQPPVQAQPKKERPQPAKIELGLYGGSFDDSNMARWFNQGKGFRIVQTYWGPSYPTVEKYVAFIGSILKSSSDQTNGAIKILVDARGVVETAADSKGTQIKVGSWGNGFQTRTMFDEQVNQTRLSTLIGGLAALPHAELIEGFYITDENLGGYKDVEATVSLAREIKTIVKTKKLKLADKIYVNFASTNPISATNPETGNLNYHADPSKRDSYNVDGKLATEQDVAKYGHRRYGIYGSNIDVVMINWFGDRRDGNPFHLDGARNWKQAKTGMDMHLHRIHLDYPGRKHIVIGYGESSANVTAMFENILQPQTEGYSFQFEGIWIWAWYGINNYRGQTIPGYSDAWSKEGERDLKPVIEKFAKQQP